ncbi:MAG: MFS transporter [Desulfobacterales bacterium]|jgi:MFS transporter, DHA1 family, inner membrane transport protein
MASSAGAPAAPSKRPSLASQVIVAVLCRLVLNTARRFPYPFAPALSRGMGVPLTAVTSLIAATQATALVGALSGPLADRLGYRSVMLAGLAMLVVGMLTAGLWPFYGIVVAALLLAALGKTVFDPAIQAFVGERVPFERRGAVIGLLEFSWSGCTLLGIPAIGLLMAHFGWRSPFFVLGGLGLAGLVALGVTLPRGGLRPLGGGGAWHFWQQLVRQPQALGTLGYAFWVSLANDNLFVVFGAWFEEAFHLSLAALGFGTVAIGVAELGGEALIALLGDRVGLKRSVLVGLIVSTACYALLPFVGQSLWHALAGLFVLFLSFEFTIVASLSLTTELVPGFRATMMAGFFAAAGIGRVAGALVGGPVWLWGGIGATGTLSACANLLALGCLLWGLKGWRHR